MPSAKKSLCVDLRQQNATTKLLSAPPLLSSHSQGWENLVLEHHYAETTETPNHSFLQHIIAIRQTKRKQGERQINGIYQPQPNGNIGDIVIIPANINHWAAWNGKAEFTLLALEPSLMAEIALAGKV